MTKKANFLIYTENIEEIEELSMEQRGVLLTALLYYQDERELPDMDAITKMVFRFLKKRIDHDNNAYEKRCLQNKANGSRGGRPKKIEVEQNQKEPKETERFFEKPKKADTEYEYDSDIDVVDNMAPQPTNDEYRAIKDAWNAIPHTTDIREIIPMTTRDNELRVLLNHYGIEKVFEGIEKIKNSRYLAKKGHISFDTYMKLDVFQKVLEGGYDKEFKNANDTQFINFEQRKYDYTALEKQLFGG